MAEPFVAGFWAKGKECSGRHHTKQEFLLLEMRYSVTHNSLTRGASCPHATGRPDRTILRVPGSGRIGDIWQRHNVYLKYSVLLGLKQFVEIYR